MTLKRPSLFVPLLLMMLSACATLGLEQPQDFAERKAYADGQVTAFVNTARNAFAEGRLSQEDSREALKIAKEASALLDTAELAAGAGDMSQAEDRLALALRTLEKLEAYLIAKEQRQ